MGVRQLCPPAGLQNKVGTHVCRHTSQVMQSKLKIVVCVAAFQVRLSVYKQSPSFSLGGRSSCDWLFTLCCDAFLLGGKKCLGMLSLSESHVHKERLPLQSECFRFTRASRNLEQHSSSRLFRYRLRCKLRHLPNTKQWFGTMCVETPLQLNR